MTGILTAAWLDVRSAPGRTFAAIGGVIAAIVAVIMVNAASELSQAANEQYIAERWGKVATFSISAQGPGDPARDDPTIETGLLTFLAYNDVQAATTYVSTVGSVAVGDIAIDFNGLLVSEGYTDVVAMDTDGFVFPSDTEQLLAPHVILHTSLTEDLGFTRENAIGKVLELTRQTVGPGEARQASFMQPVVVAGVSDNLGAQGDGVNLLIVSNAFLNEFSYGNAFSWRVHVAPSDSGALREMIDAYPWGGSLTATRIDQADDLQPMLNQQQTTALIVTGIAFTVGGLGILGVGIAGVRERGRDYGLRRAIGANKRKIFAGVVVQTLIEVSIAIVIAVPFSALLVQLTARRLVLASLPMPASTLLPVQAALIGVIGALVVGLIAGLLPALRASRTSVIDALQS